MTTSLLFPPFRKTPLSIGYGALLMLLVCLSFTETNAQLFANAHLFVGGAEIHVSDGGTVNGIVIGQSGTIQNQGTIFLNGNWENRNTAGYTVFTTESGAVNLTGGNQFISGQPTDFHDLQALGNGIKYLETDASVSGTLRLNDKEVATRSYTLNILNDSPDAIDSERPLGFISSDKNGGWVQWKTAVGEYYFPLGSGTSPDFNYRPLILTPLTTEASAFQARYVANNPSEDGYDVEQLGTGQDELCAVNPDFYHEIVRVEGQGAADLGIIHYAQLDGRYDAIAHWNAGRWQLNDVQHSTLFGNWDLTENSVISLSYSDFSYVQYALAFSKCDLYIPNVFSPNADGNNDEFNVLGKGIETIELIVYDRWGEKVFTTTDPLVSWDGTFRGKPMAPAVFVYSASVTFLTGKVITRSGNLTLLR